VQGSPRLVAYVVAQGEAALATDDLRAALRTRLPDYMLPSAFVQLPVLPLTSNGKVDVRALPAAPEYSGSDGAAGALVSPQDAIQVQLMRIFEQALQRYPVGITEDFFDIGGHSLLAVQVVDRINRLFDRQLPIDVLWHGGRTVESLASLLRGRSEGRAPVWSRAVPFRQGGSRQPLFCPPIAGGHLYFYDNLARHVSTEQPVYGLPAQGTDSQEPPHNSIEAMAAHAIRLMREVQPRGPYALLGYCSAGVVAFEMARQLEAEGEPLSHVILVDSAAPEPDPRAWLRHLISLARGRQFRMLQERTYQLLLHPLRLGRLRRLERLGEAHRWALWSYRPRPFAGRIVVIRPAELEFSRDPALGWSRYARGGIDVRTLSGAHGDLVNVRGAAQLAAEVERCIAP
jgi:thioesterase domain-containing protein